MKFIKNRHMMRILGLLVLDVLLFGTTNATTAPSFVAIVGFGLLVVTAYYIVYALIGLAGFYGLSIKRRQPLALYLTIILGILVALQSIGELGPRDVLVMLPLAFIGYVYSTYAKSAGRNLDG
jgi:hypothetical protein